MKTTPLSHPRCRPVFLMKYVLLFIFMISSNLALSQTNFFVTPEGALDKVFDQRGVQYNLSDLMTDKDGSGAITQSYFMDCGSSSIFNLYFEAGCGMDNTSDATNNARRAVLCKVFQDLSDFLTASGTALLPSSTTKVNIWVRNINNVYTNPNGILGLGTGFYCLPSNATQGGIADNEIWKTIHTGSDSYLNLSVPLSVLGGGSNQSGLFYHGMVTFNFNANNLPAAFDWNTNLSTTSIPSTKYDLYSVVLHEAVHALGFASLINNVGNSKLPSNYKYYNRYDSFLKTNNLATSIISPVSAASPMYNYGFTSGLTSTVLQPNSSSCISNYTDCTKAIKYAGPSVSQPIPVYTPNCFEDVSSLSHFEDMHYPSCNTNLPNGDNVFLMCNAGSSGMIRRYLKSDERRTLCDIGYNVKNSYGVSGAYINGTSTSFSYGGAASCGGITVAGVNDGMNNSGDYTFLATAGSNYTLSGNTILSNDIGATGGFQDLQDLSGSSTLSATSGTTATNITFNSSLAGLHLLRYVPITTGGVQKGNITYIYVYVAPIVGVCTTPPSTCNLINNADLEANSVNVTQPADFRFNKVCDWQSNNSFTYYYLQNGTTTQYSVPCNEQGSQNDKVANHKAYGSILAYSSTNATSHASGILSTKLITPLSPTTAYQLKFDISQADFFRYRNYSIQAFVSSTPQTSITGFAIPNTLLSTGILLSNTAVTTNVNGWDTVTLTFTTSAVQTNLQYVYIGVLNNPATTVGTTPQTVAGCTNTFQFYPQNGSVYYLDNFSLTATGGASLNLPNSICANQTIPNLATYIVAAPTNGVFSGNGVVFSDGVYSFNPVMAGGGNTTITYTYNTSQGCTATVSKTITVNNSPIQIPTFSFATTICSGSTAPTLPTLSTNFISGTWTPATVSNTATGNYVFKPNFGQCASEVTVTVTVDAYPVITVNPATQTVCLNGTPISLQANVAGLSAGLSYQWYSNTTNSNSGGTLISGATNASYTPVTSAIGTLYYYVIVKRHNLCAATSSVLTVIVANGSVSAGTLSGTQNLCKLGRNNPTTVLTASVAGGVWSSSNTAIASILSTTSSTATVRVAPGTATITYTITGVSGCTSSVSIVVTTSYPTVPTFSQFPVNPTTGVPDPVVICSGGSVPILPTTTLNGFLGYWDPATVSNTESGYYYFNPNAGQCADSFMLETIVLTSNTFVANNDYFTVSYPNSATITNSILANDTYFGNPLLTYTPASVNYTVTPVGTPPTIPSGGITLNSNGTFTIQPNTTPGVYTYNYKITTSCGTSNTATVMVTVSSYVTHQGKVAFPFCYNTSGNQYNTSTLPGEKSLFYSGLVGGVAATGANAFITTTPTLPSYIVLNPDGTLTLTTTMPIQYIFTYTICSIATGDCSAPITCTIAVNSTVAAYSDAVIFSVNAAPSSLNVLSNDLKWNCNTSTTATTSSVSVTQLAPFNSYFSITSGGLVNSNATAPLGTYTMQYQICDLAFPAICSTNSVTVYQTANKMANPIGNENSDLNNVRIAPNPSRDIFEITFENALSTKTSYEVYDVLGKKLFENGIDKGVTTSRINLENYPQGVYLLRITSGSSTTNKTLLKK